MSNFLDNPYFMAGLQVLRGRQDFGDALVNASMMQRQQEMENAQIAAQQQKAMQAAQAMQFRNNLQQLLSGNLNPNDRVGLAQQVLQSGGGLEEAAQLAEFLNPVGKQQIIPGGDGTYLMATYDPSGKQIVDMRPLNPLELTNTQMPFPAMAQGLTGQGMPMPETADVFANAPAGGEEMQVSQYAPAQVEQAMQLSDNVFAPVATPNARNAAGVKVTVTGETPKTRQERLTNENKQLTEIQTASENLASDLETLDSLRNLVMELNTGVPFGQELIEKYGSLMQSLGVPTSVNVRGRQLFDSQNFVNVVNKVKSWKGAISDAELRAFQNASPKKEFQPEVNASIIDAAIAQVLRVREQAAFYEAYRAKYGTLNGAQSVWKRYTEENPILQFQKNNDLIEINRNNIGNWEPYLLTEEEFKASGATKPRPATRAPYNAQAIVDELRRRGVIE